MVLGGSTSWLGVVILGVRTFMMMFCSSFFSLPMKARSVSCSVNHDSRWGIISANFEDVLDLTNRFSGCFGFNDLEVNGLLEDSNDNGGGMRERRDRQRVNNRYSRSCCETPRCENRESNGPLHSSSTKPGFQHRQTWCIDQGICCCHHCRR